MVPLNNGIALYLYRVDGQGGRKKGWVGNIWDFGLAWGVGVGFRQVPVETGRGRGCHARLHVLLKDARYEMFL